MKTIFQKIADREIPAKIEHEDEHCLVIHDIQPQAPVHLLIVPKRPITRVTEATAADQAVLGHLLLVAGVIAK
ncbi:MAG: HIT domain-containing protein, partial [Opitutus sp.]